MMEGRFFIVLLDANASQTKFRLGLGRGKLEAWFLINSKSWASGTV